MMKVKVAVFFGLIFSVSNCFAGSPVSCPFDKKEITLALGADFKEGKVGFESDFGTGKSLSCRYSGGNITLVVNQTVMKNPTQTQGWDSGLAGKSEKIPNDSDGAIRQTDQGDNTSPNLHYVRNGDIVELRILGVGKTSPQFKALQEKLTKLRRLP